MAAPNKKNILKDPLATLSSLGLSTAINTDPLVTLHNAYQSVQQQHSILTTELKTTSRKIGEAKKSNQPLDELKTRTQQLSRTIKPLTEEIKTLEVEILDLFNALCDPDNTLSASDNDSTELTEKKQPALNQRYRSTQTDTHNIVIKMIEPDNLVKPDSDQLLRLNTYVLNHPAGTIHHQIEWQGIQKKTYGHQSYYFYACSDTGDVVGVLPVTRLTSRLFGDLMVSMPFFQRGGAIADNAAIENKLILAANEQAALLGVTSIEYRDDIPRESMPAQTHKVNMILSLPDTHKNLWESFTPKLRAQIKRPQREKPQETVGRLVLLDDFYKVYTRNMRDLGSPAHSKKFISNILQTFPDNSWLVVIHLNNKAVAAALLLASKETMEIPLASTIRDVNPLSMNMFLYWTVLQFAVTKGYKRFDFGRSSATSGTYRFKQQWGAKAKQLHWHYWLADGAELPKLNPDNPKYALVISIWKRLPVFITRWMSPHIVSKLP